MDLYVLIKIHLPITYSASLPPSLPPTGQGRHSARPAAPDLRWQAAGRWSHSFWLQHPEGVDATLGPSSPRRHHRAFSPHVGAKVQLREDDLPQMLRQASTKVPNEMLVRFSSLHLVYVFWDLLWICQFFLVTSGPWPFLSTLLLLLRCPNMIHKTCWG